MNWIKSIAAALASLGVLLGRLERWLDQLSRDQREKKSADTGRNALDRLRDKRAAARGAAETGCDAVGSSDDDTRGTA